MNFDIDPGSLKPSEAKATRFTFETRFVPLKFESDTGSPFQSSWQTARAALEPKPPMASPSEIQPPKSAAPVTGDGSGLCKVFTWLQLLFNCRKADDPQPIPPPKFPGSLGFDGTIAWRDPVAAGASAAASELGVMFLERTRIQPLGFALGEHLYSMSLGPGEEVVLEQKAYSERQTSFEEATEVTSEKQSEYSSTLTSELSNALSNNVSENQTRGFNIGGGASAEIKAVKLSVDASYSNTVTSADQTTRESSARASQSSTSKVASLLRSQHKVTFKISQTDRFEASAKRTIRNPSPYTPVDLVYHKIMQVLSISHERYGLRLCWAPNVKSPGGIKASLVAQARDRMRQEAKGTLNYPKEPLRPTAPTLPPTPPVHVELHELTNWGFWGDMRADYAVGVPIQVGQVWDGNVQGVRQSLGVTINGWGTRGQPNVYVIGVRSSAAGAEVLIHGGADPGFGGAHLYVSVSVGTAASPGYVDPQFQKELDEWARQHAAWTQEVNALDAEAERQAAIAFAAWRVDFERNFDPVQALMQSFIRLGFPPTSTDEFGEVQFWSTVFDFESAVVKSYPAWWSPETLMDPTKGPTALDNASWARLFLPVHIGQEATALRWIYARSSPFGPAPFEKSISALLDDVVAYREAHFGGREEIKIIQDAPGACPRVERPYVCLGTWQEELPTDGTHLEVLQAITTAMDDASKQSSDDAHSLVVARAALTQAQSDATEEAGGRDDVSVSLRVGPTLP